MIKLTFDSELGRRGGGTSLVVGSDADRARVIWKHLANAQRVMQSIGRVQHLEVRRSAFDHVVAVVLPHHPR